jgi:hypothetical protein
MSDAAEAFTLGERAITELLGQLDAERALGDELADVLDRYWQQANRRYVRAAINAVNAEVFAVLARYREARR